MRAPWTPVTAALLLVLAAGCSSGSIQATPTGTASPRPSVTATPTADPTPTPGAGLKLTMLGTFNTPVWAGAAPGDPFHLWVVEKTGRILQTDPNGKVQSVVLDLSKAISHGNEQGLLSMAFSPDFAKNHTLYIDYIDTKGNTEVYSFLYEDLGAHHPTRLLMVKQPFPNHNGGLVLFDKTGALLVGLGDGGSAGDPNNTAQNLASPLGKILRINPKNGAPAAGNPFPQAPKVWALGLRNPWRFSFDTNGDLYLGDVGQDKIEELDVVPPKYQSGANYGWSVYEGNDPFKKGETFSTNGPVIAPAYTYLHSDGGCSITGGVVYRGKAIPALVGTYVFGDYCAGRLIGTKRTPTGVAPTFPLGLKVNGLQAFGVDSNGELLVMSADALFRVTPET